MSPARSGPGERGGAPSDEALISRFRDGDRAAFAELMRRYEDRVYSVACRMLGRGEDARDVTQDAFMSAFRNLERFRGDARFSTWLHRIAVNACYDHMRKRTPLLTDDGSLPEPDAAPDHAERAATAVDVERALLGVPVEFRAVLVLHDVQDLSLEDVADVLSLPLGTVKSRLHRGRVALGQALPREPRGVRTASNPPTT